MGKLAHTAQAPAVIFYTAPQLFDLGRLFFPYLFVKHDYLTVVNVFRVHPSMNWQFSYALNCVRRPKSTKQSIAPYQLLTGADATLIFSSLERRNYCELALTGAESRPEVHPRTG
jgi:hypothetical protein